VSAKAEATEAAVIEMAEAAADKSVTAEAASSEARTAEAMSAEAMSAEAASSEARTAEARTTEAMSAEAITAKTMAAKPAVAAATETTAAVATAMCDGAGRHRRGAEHNGRGDSNQSRIPPHQSLSFAKLRHLDGSHPAEAPDRRSSHARNRYESDLDFRRPLRRGLQPGINKRADMLKLLMRQFLTQKSVFRPTVCASTFADLVGESGR
jgi:hypothetical protein